ncbi:MAG: hypothetical protein OXI63_23275, partial [Candidatus Poribacteria bacterium]|nr:hypothetical protein [Candidatus Poribacteria bacterium]
NKKWRNREVSTCKEDITDNLIVIRREKTFSSGTRQTNQHRTPCKAISDLLLNQVIAFQSRVT